MAKVNTYAEPANYDSDIGAHNLYLDDSVTPLDLRGTVEKVVGAVGGADSQTASVVQTQVGGTAIKTRTTRFDTVANIDDAATISYTAVPGMAINVKNDGANQMKLYPAVGDQINALGVNNDLKIVAGTTKNLFCYQAGWWRT